MADPIRLSDHDPQGDAGRRGVEAMLEEALADLRTGRTPAVARAVLVLGWVKDRQLHVRPYAAGVDILSAAGLLDIGKMELYTAGDSE